MTPEEKPPTSAERAAEEKFPWPHFTVLHPNVIERRNDFLAGAEWKAAQVAELEKAVDEYEREWANPAPDYTMRSILRKSMFAALAMLKGGEK